MGSVGAHFLAKCGPKWAQVLEMEPQGVVAPRGRFRTNSQSTGDPKFAIFGPEWYQKVAKVIQGEAQEANK